MYVGSPSESLAPPWVAKASWKASKSFIHSSAKSCGCTSVLLNTKMKGSFVLYRMLDVSMSGSRHKALNAPAGVEHVRHEGCWSGGSRCVDYVCDHRWHRGCDSICDDGARRRPGEYLNLAWCIQDHIAASRLSAARQLEGSYALYGLCTLFNETKNLIKLGREEVECSQDAAVWAEFISWLGGGVGSPLKHKKRDILLHDFLVVHGVPNIDVGVKWNVRNSRIKIEDVRWRGGFLGVQIRVYTLHKCCLPRSCHAYGNDSHWLLARAFCASGSACRHGCSRVAKAMIEIL